MGQAAEIKFQLKPRGIWDSGLIAISADFDGTSLQCGLDTGSFITVVNTYAGGGAFYGSPPVGTASAAGADNIARDYDLIAISKITLGQGAGSARLRNRRAVRTGRTSHDCLLGIDSLPKTGITFSFSRGTIDLDPPAPAHTQELLPSASNFLILPIQINGETTGALLDTGAAVTVIDRSWIEKDPAGFVPVGAPQAISGLGGDTLAQLYLARSLKVNGTEFQNIHVMGVNLASHMVPARAMTVVLGYNIYSRMNWYFDRLEKVWWAEPIR